MVTSTPDEVHKVMLLGDSCVGKTSILLRFSDNVFSENFISTIGIDFRLKTVHLDGNVVKIQCWDTAGQERFHSLNLSYYRNVDGFIVVYDITDSNSFYNVENWLRGISEAANKEYASILIGNKIDLVHKREVSVDQGVKLAAKYNMAFTETSALENVNIEESFMSLAAKIREMKLIIKNNEESDQIKSSNIESKLVHLKPISSTNNIWKCC